MSDNRPCSEIMMVKFQCTVPGNRKSNLRWFLSDMHCSIRYVEGAHGSFDIPGVEEGDIPTNESEGIFGKENAVENGTVVPISPYSVVWNVVNDSVDSTLFRIADLLNRITVSCVDQYGVVIGSTTVQLASKYPKEAQSC